jgi:hypothetical protein
LGATERVRRAIAADIAKQEFPPGSVLPDYKLMAGRYGGSYRTLRNALLMLLEERRLTAHGRGFQVSSLPAPASAAGIVVIAQTDDTAVLSHFTPRSPQLWRCLEEQCRRLNVRTEIRGYFTGDGRADTAVEKRSRALVDPRRDEGVLGYLVCDMELETPMLAPILDRLIESGKPVSVVDEKGHMASLLQRPGASGPLVRLFSLGVGPHSGRIVADHLLRHGHQAAACISLVDTALWCRSRAEGVEEAFSRAGGNAKRFVLKHFADFSELDRALRSAPHVRRLQADLAAYEATANPDVPGRGDLFGANVYTSAIWGAFLRPHVEELFEQALADRALTAWAPVSDLVAFLALQFLKRKRVKVPADISVVGFDNTVEAFACGLSSYDFNEAAAVHAALEHLLKPPSPRGRRAALTASEVEGFVMQRRTTAPPSRT